MATTFRYANYNEYGRISQFLHDYWANNHVYCRDKLLFDWTFDRRDEWSESGYSFALAEDEGQLVGILGGIPFSFNCFGRRSHGVWIANWVISPEHRRGPTALKLLSTFRRPDFQPVVAFGINAATVPVYKILRGEVLPPAPRYFALLPEATGRMARVLELANPSWSQERARGLAERLAIPRTLSERPQTGAAIPERWDETDWAEIATQTVGAARDSAYLNWRYVHHPRFQYRIVTLPEGRRTGLLVWRLETIHRLVDGQLVPVDLIGRMVEFLPVSNENAQRLLDAFLLELDASGALGADFYTFHGPTRTLLATGEFVDVHTIADGQAVPSRLQPLDGESGDILSAMFLPENVPPCTLAPDCPWYWTKSDSDQDRPN